MELVFKNITTLLKEEQEEILKIRNLPLVKSQMKTDETICLKEHFAWILGLKKDLFKRHYAIFHDGGTIGSVNIVGLNTTSPSWGIYFQDGISPFVKVMATFLFLEQVFEKHLCSKLYSQVKKTNKNAYKFNLSFGFLAYKEDLEYHYMYLDESSWQKIKITLLKKLTKISQNLQYKFIK